MTAPRSAEEWALECFKAGHLNFQITARGMCLDCARAFAAQETAALRAELTLARGVMRRSGEIAQEIEGQNIVLRADLSTMKEVATYAQGLETDLAAHQAVLRELAEKASQVEEAWIDRKSQPEIAARIIKMGAALAYPLVVAVRKGNS